MYMLIIAVVVIALTYFSIRERFRQLREVRSGERKYVPVVDKYDIIGFIVEKIFGL